jgi:uncharacterized protein (TIGR01777 family)
MPETTVVSTACVFGASGLLGTALCRSLRADGARAIAFGRRAGRGEADHARWDPAAGGLERDALEGVDAVVNLAGENLSRGRWTKKRKQELWQSRVDASAFLARELCQLRRPPRDWVNASAVGFYGDRGDEAVHEDSSPGKGFVAELCQAWEAATQPAREAGIRTVLPRFGVVLSAEGGALAKMLPAFRMGAGGRLGAGTQRMPWITLVDAVSVIRFALTHDELSGPVNAVAPESVSNAQLSETLGRVLGRPVVMAVPAMVLKAAMGEMASELLLSGANVRPRRLEVAGYRFEYPRLDDALEALLPRRPSQTSS